MTNMRRFCFSLIPALAFALAGCLDFPGQGNPAGGNLHTAPFIGKEPPLTILLAEYHGPAAQADAQRLCADLLSHGFSEAFVVADADEAYLCYGTYSDMLDKNYHENRVKVAQISNPDGKPAFGPGLGVLLPEAAPRSRFDLAHAHGSYTVMVATFDLYGHKHAAEEYAEQLRAKKWPAYVFQGDVMSHVTIGAFKDDIFAADEKGTPLSPDDKAALANLNLHQKAAREFFEEWKESNLQAKKGVKAAPVIVSPEVKNILTTFPYLNWDGHVFTAEEAAKMQGTSTRRLEDPQHSTVPDVMKKKTNFAHLIKSSLVVIPTPDHGPGGSATPPPPPARPRSPIPSSNR